MSGSTMHDGRSAWRKTVGWPRWRRPGQGRRANQHTRIAVNDATGHQLQLDAINAHHTIGR